MRDSNGNVLLYPLADLLDKTLLSTTDRRTDRQTNAQGGKLRQIDIEYIRKHNVIFKQIAEISLLTGTVR